MKKATITQDDYLRLCGLLALAADNRAMLDSIEHSALALTGDHAGGHTTDVIWGGTQASPLRLLELLGITAEEA
jgi:hypothetical protein